MTNRLPQDTLDALLTEDNPTGRALGRLIAAGAFERYEAWLDAEDLTNADRAIEALQATIVFGVYLIRGIASENFRQSPESIAAIKEIVTRKMEIAFNA